MRENNPFDDTNAATDPAGASDPASANAINALNEPKKSGFFGGLTGRKKPAEPPTAAEAAPAADFSGADTAYSPLVDETQPAPTPEPPQPTEPQPPETFQKKPPVAIDGVSPDYNTPVANQPTAPYEPAEAAAPRYEDFQPAPVAEQPYAPPQPTYQQPYQPDYYQPTDPYVANNQPLNVNYGTTPNIYDPYNPYATMVDLNPNAPDPNKKPDWKFVITFSIAIICFAGMIFFAISYAGEKGNAVTTEAELIELQNKSAGSSKDALKIEDLENTVRELTTKNDTLTKSNDDLKKNEDKVKELETANTTLQTDKQSWQDKYYDVLTRCGEKCAGTSSTSSSSD